MKKTFTIILTLIGFLTFGQEIEPVEIDDQSKSIDSDSELIELNFNLNNESKSNTTLKIWHKDNRIFKIVQEKTVDYGELKSVIYLDGKEPFKIIESESTYYFLPDSIAQIKGYSIDIKENFKAVSYITNWNKKERKLFVSGEPTEEKQLSYELNKYSGIIRKAKKLVSQ